MKNIVTTLLLSLFLLSVILGNKCNQGIKVPLNEAMQKAINAFPEEKYGDISNFRIYVLPNKGEGKWAIGFDRTQIKDGRRNFVLGSGYVIYVGKISGTIEIFEGM